MKISLFSFKVLFAMAIAAALLFSGCEFETQAVRFGAGNKGGLYDKFADDLVNKAKGKNITVQKKITSGTSANIRLLEQGFVDVGIVQADVLKDYLMRNRIRSVITAVGGLYNEYIQIVVPANSEIRNAGELAGKRVSIGEEESGVVRNAEVIFEAYGVLLENIEIQKLSLSESVAALAKGEIDAFFYVAGVPTPSIQELARNMEIRLLSMDSSSVERIANLHDELACSVIPAGTYAGQDSAIHTLAVKSILVASQLLDSAVVEKIAEIALPDFEFATSNIPVKFHPGAAAFYARKNVKVEVAAPLQGHAPVPSTGD